jgi:hypothetical protein
MRQFYPRVTFIVSKGDVVFGSVAFDEACLVKKGFCFRAGDKILNGDDLLQKSGDTGRMRTGCLKVGKDTFAKGSGLAHIKGLVSLPFHEINPRCLRERFYPLL